MFDYINKVNPKNTMIQNIIRQDSYENIFQTDLAQIIDFDEFPEDLNTQLLKLIAINEGMCGLYKDGEEYYICSVSQVGFPRKDGRPYEVIARYLKKGITGYSVEVKDGLINDKDIVLYYFTDFAKPDYNIERFAYMLSEVDISMKANVKYSRLKPMVRAKDDNEKTQINKSFTEETDGVAFVSDTTFEDLLGKEQNPVINITDVANSDKLQYLSHFHLDLLNRFYSMYGMGMNTTGKMAQQSVEEIKGSDACGWLLPMSILRQGKEFCERANKLYGLNLSCHFGKIHEMLWERFTKDCTKNDTPNGDIHDENEDVKELENNEGINGDLESETDNE